VIFIKRSSKSSQLKKDGFFKGCGEKIAKMTLDHAKNFFLFPDYLISQQLFKLKIIFPLFWEI